MEAGVEGGTSYVINISVMSVLINVISGDATHWRSGEGYSQIVGT